MNISNLLAIRQAKYLFFSRAFARPFDNLFFKDCITISSTMKILMPDTCEMVDRLITLINKADNNIIIYEMLYSSLFMTGAYGRIISPCGSVYFSGEGLIMGREREEVLKIYTENNVSLSQSFKEPEDHISAQLSFMANMATKNNISSKKTQLRFLENHLIKLTERFAGDMKELDNNGIYHILSSLTLHYVHIDKLLLEDIINGSQD